MAFCNKCGATITQGTRFCNKCGAPILASGFQSSSATPTPATPPAVPAPVQRNNSALRVVLIVIGVIIVVGAVGIAALTFVGLHIAKNSRVKQDGDRVKVETPFGTVETSKDPEEVAKNLGIDIYPGAEVQKNGAGSATFGNLQTVNATFKSSDSVDKVCGFYKSRFPNANVTTSDENHCTIVSNAPPNVITINIELRAGGSQFRISSVTKK